MTRLMTIMWISSAAAGWAAQPDYFPLQVGNQWVLQTTSSTPEILNIEVLRSSTLDGQIYFLLTGYAPDQRWVRKAEDGTLYSLDEKAGTEAPLARLTIGSIGFQSALSGCEQWAQPAAGPTYYRGPHFDGTGGLIVQYDPNACRDVGLTHETYAPAAGLVRRSITTIRGELTFDLIYARVNGTPLIGKSGELVLTYDFNHGSKGWLAEFSDYTLRTSDLRMLAELRPLAEEVSRTKSGFYIQSIPAGKTKDAAVTGRIPNHELKIPASVSELPVLILMGSLCGIRAKPGVIGGTGSW